MRRTGTTPTAAQAADGHGWRRLRRYGGTALLVGALVLIPWALYLGYTLPARHRVVHWDAIWFGFDLALALALLLTAVAAIRGRPWLAIPATASGTLLICDAWFDVLTARGAHELTTALLEAVLIELPLAALCIWMALRVDRVLLRRAAGRRIVSRRP
jgi:hypothetical protein